jgi:trypsin
MIFFFSCFLIQISFTTYSCSSNSTCGCSLNPVILTKIIGGEEVGEDTWGWAVSISLRNNHICGGSLISSELILTAAHCVNSIQTISSLSVTAGSKYLSIINQRRSVSEIAIHRNYHSGTFANDIAVIRLSSPFNMNDPSLTLICLPPNIIRYPPEDITVVAIGWGVLSRTDGVVSNTLQQVTLKTIGSTVDSCQRAILNKNVQFCAGVQGGGKGIENQY